MPLLNGKSLGPHGAYELIEGRVYFAFDPGNPANDRIVDLGPPSRKDQQSVTRNPTAEGGSNVLETGV